MIPSALLAGGTHAHISIASIAHRVWLSRRPRRVPVSTLRLRMADCDASNVVDVVVDIRAPAAPGVRGVRPCLINERRHPRCRPCINIGTRVVYAKCADPLVLSLDSDSTWIGTLALVAAAAAAKVVKSEWSVRIRSAALFDCWIVECRHYAWGLHALFRHYLLNCELLMMPCSSRIQLRYATRLMHAPPPTASGPRWASNR